VAGSDLPPLLFDDEQAVAVALALAVAPASGADVAEAAARALVTVRQLLPARLRHRVDAVGAVTATGRVLVDPDVLVVVSESVHRREVLRFTYASDGVDRPARRVEPHAVVARHSRWYLLAYDLDVDGWRTYRIDRITPRPRTSVGYAPREVPGGDPATFVAAHFKGAVRDDAWPCSGSVLVAADVIDGIAPYLPEDALVVEAGPDRCRITLGSYSWTGLAGVVAGLSVEVTVDGPTELSDAVLALSGRLRAAVAT
jgi:predicted DNA-binding transcriptional regulator YafY